MCTPEGRFQRAPPVPFISEDESRRDTLSRGARLDRRSPPPKRPCLSHPHARWASGPHFCICSFSSATYWYLHLTLTSDHFGILIQQHSPRYNLRLANWSRFHELRERLFTLTDLSDTLHELTSTFVTLIQEAADFSIPLTKQPGQSHKDRWIYGSRLREVHRRLNLAMKNHRRFPSNTIREYLKSVVRHVHTTKLQLRNAT